MDVAISVIEVWKDLIIKVFGEYPLAGALMTLLSIYAFFVLEKARHWETPVNVAAVLMGWAIGVPLVGLIFSVVSTLWRLLEAVSSGLWGFIKAAFSFLSHLIGSFYRVYVIHPILVIILCISAVIGYFVWRHWWPAVWPSRSVRISTLFAATILLAIIFAPIVALFPEIFDGKMTP